MEYPLKSHNVKAPLRPEDMLKELIKTCPSVGISYVEIPMLAESRVKGDEDAEWIVSFINGMVPLAERNDVDLLLEMSLPAKEISALLKQIPSPRIKINYDTGNSAYWDYEPREEISAVTAKLLAEIPIIDLSVEDPPIEDVIETVFAEGDDVANA